MIKRVLCFTNPAYLSLRLKQLVVEQPQSDQLEPVRHTIPVEDIGVVIMENPQITVTQSLIAALLDNNCAIITCDLHHLPAGLLLPLDNHNLQSERFREQINASEPLRKQMWQQTIVSKITSQTYVLKQQNIEYRNMLIWAKSVRSGDTDNLEGRAAAYYWRNVFGDTNFVRGQFGDMPNGLLNYGYSIVRAMMARALVATGLLPTLGIHHHSRYDAYCLADDIMEPYRAYVDLQVLDMWNRYGDVAELSPALKKELLSLSTADVQIEGHRSPMMIAMQTTANSVQRCFSGESRKIIYPDWQV